MAVNFSKCSGLSLFSFDRGSRNSGAGKKPATHQACYPQSNPMVQRISLPSVDTDARAIDDYSDIMHMENIKRVKHILMQIDDSLESMHTIDYLQKLGIDYRFKEEIENMLGFLHENVSNYEDQQITNDLFQVTLSFRLLRQAGYPISSDVLNNFIDEGKSTLNQDVQGLVSLYEASHLNTGEDILLYKANLFSRKQLESCIQDLEPNVARLVRHSMKNPCHMTISRYNARHFLDHFQNGYGFNGALEELARLDFNLVQSLHKKELEEILSWWKSTGLAEQMKFIRNQPLKWYLWPMTVLPDPEFSWCRIQMTKIVSFVYIIDDIFDVYGSPNELEHFTEAISKWDLSVVETLPDYMQSCYTILYNFTHEIAQTISEEQGLNPINYLQKSWERLCNAFLIESRWLRAKHIPKADEYLRNAVISSGAYTVLMHTFFLLGQGITKENAKFLECNPTILSCPATILRLWDDLGSAKDENQEGYDGSYVDCYMKDHPNSSTEDARDHVKQIISNTWEKLNKECFSRDHFAPNLVTAALNSARMIEVMYRYDENQNLPILEDYINALLFKSM